MTNENILKETDSYVLYECKDWRGNDSHRKEKKFFCVGGPFDGEWKTITQVGKEYAGFNNSAHSRVYTSHNMIWVYAETLAEAFEDEV